MGTDAIGFSLAILAIGMSMIAVEYRQPILGVGASALWAGFMGFILANTTAGLAWQVMTVLGCITFIIAMLFMGFLTRRISTTDEKSAGTERGGITRVFTRRLSDVTFTRPQGRTAESAEEYKYRVRSTLTRSRGRTRRRR